MDTDLVLAVFGNLSANSWMKHFVSTQKVGQFQFWNSLKVTTFFVDSVNGLIQKHVQLFSAKAFHRGDYSRIDYVYHFWVNTQHARNSNLCQYGND